MRLKKDLILLKLLETEMGEIKNDRNRKNRRIPKNRHGKH